VADTRSRLITAAEQLFAERGIEAVSLREITRASGARNVMALQYHFDDREGLVQAILAKHLPAVDARRTSLLDALQDRGEADLRSMAAALVRPLAEKLTDRGGGPEFLQVWAELLNRPSPVFVNAVGPGDSLERWRSAVEPLLAADAARLHRRFTAILHTAVELARRAASGHHSDDRLFTSYLVDVVEAILAAPVSDETRRLADERDSARRRRR
jgi:AcrR family transcriptional regulator